MMMHLPFRLSNAHKQLDILNRHPTSEHLHGILKVRVEQNLAHAVDESRGRGVDDVQAFSERAHRGWRMRRCVGSVGSRGGGGSGGGVLSVRAGCGGMAVGVSEEHEYVPDAELGGEGDGVVEEG